jgi:hypothetical protein
MDLTGASSPIRWTGWVNHDPFGRNLDSYFAERTGYPSSRSLLARQESDAVLGEPGEQVMAARPDEAAASDQNYRRRPPARKKTGSFTLPGMKNRQFDEAKLPVELPGSFPVIM